MLEIVIYIKIFVAMTVIVNPLGIMPVFVAMTANQTIVERKRIARIAAFTVAIVLIISAVFGESILELFGISIASFKVGGSVLVMLSALQMMQAMPTREKQTPEEAEEAVDKASIAVVPLGVPLLAGPGAMSTIIIYVSQNKALWHLGSVLLVALAVSLAVWIALRVATQVGKYMSHTTINIATRIMGLLLAALAVEIFSGGIVELLPGLGPPDVFNYRK